MSDPMRIRTMRIKDTIEVKLLVKHPMESGYRKGEDGKRIPAHFIETLVVRCKDKVIFDAYLGIAVSENPYIEFNFKGAEPGDLIEATWVDNLKDTRTDSAVVKYNLHQQTNKQHDPAFTANQFDESPAS